MPLSAGTRLRRYDVLVRFKREALILSSLNHTNIAQIHGIEEGGRALVLEQGPKVNAIPQHGRAGLPPAG